MDGEGEGLLHALEMHRAVHRSPPVAVEKLLACFVRMSDAIARLVDEAAVRAGVTHVHLLGAAVGPPPAGDVALLDWRALALPALDWSSRGAAARGRGTACQDRRRSNRSRRAHGRRRSRRDCRMPALRHGSLLIEPTFDVWGHGRLRVLQCGASDPVSAGLLDGRAHAAFPEVPGWSARDWARRAVAEHRAWLFAGRNQQHPSPHRWMGLTAGERLRQPRPLWACCCRPRARPCSSRASRRVAPN